MLISRCSTTPFETPATFVSAGSSATCSLNAGKLRCWGYWSVVNFLPSLPPEAPGWSSVSVGDLHACAVTNTTGQLLCWGYNENYGQFDVPVFATPATKWTQVSAGWRNTCGVTSAKSVVCFGKSDYGVNTTPRGAYIAVSVGVQHACAVTTEGKIVCWGANRNKKVLKPPALPANTTWVSVSAADCTSCALTDRGAIFCWGDPASSNAGDLSGLGDVGQLRVPSGYVWTAVSGAYYHYCGLTANASTVCWGWNGWGNNGTGQLNVPTLPPFARKWVQVSARGGYSTCALSDDGAIKCWGANYWGQLDAPSTPAPAPSCHINADCTSSLCIAGKCLLRNGATCDANLQCGSGSCVRAVGSEVNVCGSLTECAVPALCPASAPY